MRFNSGWRGCQTTRAPGLASPPTTCLSKDNFDMHPNGSPGPGTDFRVLIHSYFIRHYTIFSFAAGLLQNRLDDII